MAILQSDLDKLLNLIPTDEKIRNALGKLSNQLDVLFEEGLIPLEVMTVKRKIARLVKCTIPESGCTTSDLHNQFAEMYNELLEKVDNIIVFKTLNELHSFIAQRQYSVADERRKSVRINAAAQASIILSDGAHDIVITDISFNGLRFFIDRTIETNKLYIISIFASRNYRVSVEPLRMQEFQVGERSYFAYGVLFQNNLAVEELRDILLHSLRTI